MRAGCRGWWAAAGTDIGVVPPRVTASLGLKKANPGDLGPVGVPIPWLPLQGDRDGVATRPTCKRGEGEECMGEAMHIGELKAVGVCKAAGETRDIGVPVAAAIASLGAGPRSDLTGNMGG
mmetsp:Transcript_65432/g.139992  ORF Transcript_65432/g.139992 Transcript_65432/m.139992 type:complete len:121 (+) Transcript_65432:116-478(+)